jgi:hypothetical protein
LIVDFKTAANASVPVAISHEIQLTSYAYLLRTATDRTEGELRIRSLAKTNTPSVVTHRSTRSTFKASSRATGNSRPILGG